MAVALQRDRSHAPRITQLLETMASRGEWPAPEAENLMRYFDDALGLARQRVTGTPESVERQLLAFLTRYRSSAV